MSTHISTKTGRWPVVIGLALAGVGGAFLPWVWRQSVALQLTGPGLAEFVKFLPEVRTGQLTGQRLYFLLPLFVAMLALPPVVANSRLALPAWLRWGLRLLVIPLALAALSPVWTPGILTSPEFRLQTGLVGLAMGLAVAAPLLKRLPLRPVAALVMAGSTAALVLPWWQFQRVQPALVDVYRQPVALGWGWWLTAAGLLLSLAGAGLLALRPA